MKAVKIYPSKPISFAKGLIKVAICVNMLIPEILILAKSHITIPAGSATAIALPKNK